MGTIVYELKERLHHHRYSWPLSMVRYPLRFGPGEAHLGSFRLIGPGGVSCAMQIMVKASEGEYLLEGELVFLTDLPRGAVYRYELHYEASALDLKVETACAVQPVSVRQENGGTAQADNGHLRLSVVQRELAGPTRQESGVAGGERRSAVFALAAPSGEELAVASLHTSSPVELVSSRCTAAGPILYEQSVQYRFADGGSYLLRLRLIAGTEWMEVEEEVDGGGFDTGAPARLELVWHGLEPDRRYTQYRGSEAMDAYLEPDGALPYMLLPFDSWRSWHRCKTAEFADDRKGLAAGIWVYDAVKWNDGEYALWRSSDTLAVRFHYRRQEVCNGKRLVWTYPLSKGTRCTAVGLYAPARCRPEGKPNEGGTAGSGEADGAYVDFLWLWHTLIPLDKVKDWVLDWEEPQAQYPLLFDPDRLPPSVEWWYYERYCPPVPADMEEIVEKLSYSFNQVMLSSPVTSREFSSWVPIFDMAAPSMTAEQFDRLKAASVFMAYVREDENLMPTRNMLAGHPNFLADMMMVPGYMAALFPHHPHAERWMLHVERALALNLKYHVRPQVTSWGAEGGRWTENLGCYVWAALVPMVRTAWALRKVHGLNILANPALPPLARWLLDSMTAPVAGVRTYPPQGAHSAAHLDPLPAPYILRVLGELLMQYEPLLGEHLLSVCPADAPGFESSGGDVWRQMLDSGWKDNPGTQPGWQSRKYTGYGYVLRSAGGTPSEMSVHVQQIDEGPNYRWGRAAEGGCGTVYYYAEGRRYSYNRPEDIGDDNMGDGEAGCSFAVLKGHEYCSIGRNELTEPLCDADFAQYAVLLAGPRSAPQYRSRSVLMSGNDYVAIYDQVADMRVRGRFSWFTRTGEKPPAIYQLKPGAAGVPVKPAGPVDQPPVSPGQYAAGKATGYPDGSRGQYFDGFGDFLTLVTHRERWQPQLLEARGTPYGAKVVLCGRTDHLFRQGTEIRHEEEGLLFHGTAGIIRVHGPAWAEAALFAGSRIGAEGVAAAVAGEDGLGWKGCFSFVLRGQALHGRCQAAAATRIRLDLAGGLTGRSYRLTVNGRDHSWTGCGKDGRVEFVLPPGACGWEWTCGKAAPASTEILRYEAAPGQAEVFWTPVDGADAYRVAASSDGGQSWHMLEEPVRGASCRLGGMGGGCGKLHVRVRAVRDGLDGPWSGPYPVYLTADPPPPPDGLRLSRTESGTAASWGMVPGAAGYRLYRRAGGENRRWEQVYEGPERFCVIECAAGACLDGGGTGDEYRVSALNGNGEGLPSRARNTREQADRDPKPEEGFRRYVRSHEYGYSGYDYREQAARPDLPPYPQ
ncbi:hypothetical protein [Paenibacillus sp. YN15]|uniref:hypothetical protein n=1 Tax=Paenibacillus sp. YN15 TaxID=1742774 RepID=UPI000DCD805A|nr:hypothetical protein [Paenibacillus sp. YN15]RAV06388.1 hypothetical protein DQG13_00650 [Paenibacillus sp. YN15]